MNAVLFYSYGAVVKNFEQSNQGEQLALWQVAVSGFAAGLATSFITGPTELVKCLAQTNLKSEGRIREEWFIARDLVRQQGLFGRFGPARGLLTTIVRETPAFGYCRAGWHSGGG